ncbi:MAG: DUF4160 domain-containing protein [Qipengyuania sp.]|jgi:hypothetical protein|nr:DUF4160 domain-containing protein [Qipengyuania sp.]
MVTVHREAGLRFIIFKDDHPPAHVHVVGDGRAKIELVGPDGNPRILHYQSFKTSDVRRMMQIAIERQAELLARWGSIHG